MLWSTSQRKTCNAFALIVVTIALTVITISLPVARTDVFTHTPTTMEQPSAVSQPASGSSSGTYFDHLVFIIMENAGIDAICGSSLPPPCNGPNNPYMSGLANNNGIATQYVDLAGSSQPNYIGIMAATLNGCTSGCGANSLSEINLVDRFEAAGLTWKAYMENQTPIHGCDNSDHGFYEAIHNPFVSFHDIDTNSTRCSKIGLANPANNSTCTGTDCALVNDLNSGSVPNFMWLTPNDCDNMHGNSACSDMCMTSYTTACYKAGDNYLSSLVPNILNSNTFKNTRAALFITFDEGSGFCPFPNPGGEDCMYTVWAGSTTKGPFANNTFRTHYAFTKTIETNWGLATMTSNDASATAMTEFFSTPSADFSISATSPAPVNAGQSATSTITVSALNGFTGTVSLTDTIPSGLSCGSITPNSITGSGTATVSCSATNAGNYTLTTSGTSGSLVHTATALWQIRDFTIAASSVTVNAGISGTSTIAVTPVNRFAGTVTLTDTVPSGLVCGSITPGSVTGSGTATVSCSATVPANFTLTITGTSGSLVHTATPIFHVQDFGIAASSPAPVNAGSSAISTITISAVNHFSGVVSLTDTVPSGLTCGAITPSSLTGSGTATVLCSTTVAGNYTLTLTGTGGSLVHTITALFQYRDFTVVASSPGPVNAGSSTITTVTVASVNNFGGIVSLTDTIPSGLTCVTITPNSVTGSGTATVSCNATGAGNYTLSITGTSSSLVHSATTTFQFQNFIISASSPPPANSGQSAASTITLGAVNGFAGVVTLTDTVPSGLTCGTITPGTVTGSGTATVSCSATVAGTYTLTVRGTNGALVHSANATFDFVDFTIAASSPTPVNAGSSANSTITIVAVNGFAGPVSLNDTAPSGLTCGTITPSSLTGSGTATVSCSATIAGNYTLTVTGTAGSLFHSASALLQFRDFTIAAASPTAANVGLMMTTTITVTALNHFSGTVLLSDTVPPGLACGTISPISVTGSGTATVSCSASLAGNYTLILTGMSGSFVHTTTAIFQFWDFGASVSSPAPVNAAVSATSTITITAANHFNASVSLADTVPSGLVCATINPSSVAGSGSATVSCNATVAGNYTLTVTGTSGALVHNATALFQFQDFGITASTPTPVNTGSSATVTITIVSVNHFAGTVSLTDITPSGLACGTINPISVIGSGTATVSCNATAAGNYTLTVVSASGSLNHSATALFRVQDFSISATSPAPVNAGVSATSMITVTPVNNFTGVVNLNDNIPTGMTCNTINPSSVTSSGTAVVSCTSNIAGNYTLTVTGTSGALSHSATIFLAIQDYAITATPTSVEINAGSPGSSIVTITALNHFYGPISLSASGTAGLTSAVSPTSLPNGSGTASLTFSSSTAGNYTATITSSSGTLTHIVTVNVQVVDFAVAASPSTITILAGATGNSTITVAAMNGFSATVNLILTPSMGLAAATAPTSIGGSGSSTMSVSASTSGDYSITIRAASGSLSHMIVVVIHVLDYSLAGNPVNPVAPIGSSTSSTVTVQSLNGYGGNLNVTYTVQADPGTSSGSSGAGGGRPSLRMAPPGPILPIVSINPQSFQLSSGGTQQSTVSISLPSNLPAGNYLITVIASDGTLSHQIVMTLAATDFSITATPSSVSIRPGSNTTIVLNLQSLNFFQGNVTLTVNSPSGGPNGTLTTSMVRLTFNGNVNLNLTIVVPANTALGNYTITVQATSGTVSHTLSIPVRVTSTGFVTILAEIFSSHNVAPIAGLALFTLLTTFATLKVRIYTRKEPSICSGKRIQNHNFRRSEPTRYVPSSSSLPLFWSPTCTDISKI